MWRKFMLQIIKEIPIEAFPPRPRLTGREKTVAVEPFKPKRKYHIRKAKAPTYRQRRTYRSRNRRYSPPRTNNPAPAAKTTATPAPAPAVTSSPTPAKPFIRKHNKEFNPAYNSDRDWVKERLGR